MGNGGEQWLLGDITRRRQEGRCGLRCLGAPWAWGGGSACQGLAGLLIPQGCWAPPVPRTLGTGLGGVCGELGSRDLPGKERRVGARLGSIARAAPSDPERPFPGRSRAGRRLPGQLGSSAWSRVLTWPHSQPVCILLFLLLLLFLILRPSFITSLHGPLWAQNCDSPVSASQRGGMTGCPPSGGASFESSSLVLGPGWQRTGDSWAAAGAEGTGEKPLLQWPAREEADGVRWPA